MATDIPPKSSKEPLIGKVGYGWRFRRQTKKQLGIFSVVALTVVGAGWAWVYYRGLDGTFGDRVCQDTIIVAASQQITNNDLEALARTTSQIKGMGQYQTDSNCVYILARAAMQRNDIPEARVQLALFRKIGKPLSQAFTIEVMSPWQLESLIIAKEQAAQFIQQQTKSMTEETSQLDQAADNAKGRQ